MFDSRRGNDGKECRGIVGSLVYVYINTSHGELPHKGADLGKSGPLSSD